MNSSKNRDKLTKSHQNTIESTKKKKKEESQRNPQFLRIERKLAKQEMMKKVNKEEKIVKKTRSIKTEKDKDEDDESSYIERL